MAKTKKLTSLKEIIISLINNIRRVNGNYYVDKDNFWYVYLMANWRKDKSYKIWFTTQNPEERLNQGKTFNPRISLVCFYWTQDYTKEEKYWHNRFKKHHEINEWFVLEDNHIKEFVARAKTYDVCYNDSSFSPDPEEASARFKRYLSQFFVKFLIAVLLVLFVIGLVLGMLFL